MTGAVETRLPAGWSVARVSEIAKVNPPLDETARAETATVSFVPMTAVEAQTGAIDLSRIRRLSEVRKGYRHFRERDVLFAKITPCMENGKMAVVPRLKYGLGFGSTEFHVLRPHEEIRSEYLYRFVSAARFRRDAEHHMTGAVGQRRVPTSYLGEQIVPLPPASEQHRIESKIKQLFAELDAGVESLKKALAQLGTYRQAVLKHAFEGKLTVQWRDQNKDSIEKPEQLIARIKQRREAQFEQQVLAWKTALREWNQGGKNDDKPRKPKQPPTVGDISDDVLSTLPTLADSWIWGKLGLMTCGVEYGTAAKSSASGDVPVLRMGNIQDAKLDWSDLAYTSDHDEIRRYSLKDGDVLFNRTNSPELVGKSALYRGERPAIFAGYLIRINHMESVVDGQYVNLFLNSRVARQYGNSVKTDGVNQSNINGAKLVEYPFPYCSIEEQREATTILDRTISHLEEMEAEIVKQLHTANILRQAILKSAFSGQLVPQDPSDEPASVLLDRIRIEREQAAKRKTRPNTGKRRPSV